MDAQTFDLSAVFTFDSGSSPAVGQEWAIQYTFQVGEWVIEVQTVRFTGKGYEFELRAPQGVKHVELEILGANAVGGYGASDDQGKITVGLEYQSPPQGRLTVQVSGVIFSYSGDWSIQWSPDDATSSSSLYGLQLVLDRTVELEQGYYLIGHLTWEDERIQSASPGTRITARDAHAKPLELEPVSFGVFSQLVPNFTEADWVVYLPGKTFALPITLHLEKVNLMLRQPLRLTLDLPADDFAFDKTQSGTPYDMGSIPLQGLPDLSAQLAQVAYVRQGELAGFELFFEADPRLSGLSFQPAEGFIGLDGESRLLIESYRDEGSGWLVSRLLTDCPMILPLTFTALDFQIRGDWTVVFQPLQSK